MHIANPLTLPFYLLPFYLLGFRTEFFILREPLQQTHFHADIIHYNPPGRWTEKVKLGGKVPFYLFTFQHSEGLQMVHQMARHILHTVAATEVDT